jgi:hypothetical protein
MSFSAVRGMSRSTAQRATRIPDTPARGVGVQEKVIDSRVGDHFE